MYFTKMCLVHNVLDISGVANMNVEPHQTHLFYSKNQGNTGNHPNPHQ